MPLLGHIGSLQCYTVGQTARMISPSQELLTQSSIQHLFSEIIIVGKFSELSMMYGAKKPQKNFDKEKINLFLVHSSTENCIQESPVMLLNVGQTRMTH